MIELGCLWTVYCSGEAVSHIFLSLGKEMEGSDLQTRMVVPNYDPSCRSHNLVEAVPRFLKWWYYRRGDAPRAMTEKRFLRELQDFDATYLWVSISLDTFRSIKKAGKPIFLERINCYAEKAKRILDDAYKRLEMQPQHSIAPETIKQEAAEVDLADFIFCPSPEVKQSFQEAGVPEQKLISTSYGWSPQRFPNISVDKPQQDTVTVLFVGYVCVRKGAHLLLRAWEQAGVKGKLMLCGRMEPAIAEACREILARPDVVYSNYNKDISFAYRQADIFAFPSLEEGSPLVTYEAMAHGLPVLVSPMGAGGIARDGIDGAVVSPYDEDAWVEALRKLANSPDLRHRLGASARQRAEEFTWDKVGAKRAAFVHEKLGTQLVT